MAWSYLLSPGCRRGLLEERAELFRTNRRSRWRCERAVPLLCWGSCCFLNVCVLISRVLNSVCAFLHPISIPLAALFKNVSGNSVRAVGFACAQPCTALPGRGRSVSAATFGDGPAHGTGSETENRA